MAQYLLLYHDPVPTKTKIDQMEKVAKMDMFEREISNAVLDGGSPTLDGKKITAEEVTPLQKKKRTDYYCIIEADDPHEAVELARGAPPLHEGGTAELYEIASEEE